MLMVTGEVAARDKSEVPRGCSQRIASQPITTRPTPGSDSLEGILFDSCPACHAHRMASIPQGAFAAKKVRVCMDKDTMPVSNMKTSDKSSSSRYEKYAKKDFEYLPAKYNSKMMNSIWGLYNRYSVHNLKKITDDEKKDAQQWSHLSAVTLAPSS